MATTKGNFCYRLQPILHETPPRLQNFECPIDFRVGEVFVGGAVAYGPAALCRALIQAWFNKPFRY
jgi:hypothetical protein